MSNDQFALLISLLSLVTAVVAIMDSRKAREIARDSNDIAKASNDISRHYNLIPRRLEARRLVLAFVNFCSTFRTRFGNGIVKSGSELLDHRDAFMEEYDALGPLGMPKVEERVSQITGRAVQLQRAIDRTKNRDPKPLDSQYNSLDENLDALVDYFGDQRRELPALFKEYLTDA